jgi:RNA polymerase sigma-70 factor, ECF subfamily
MDHRIAAADSMEAMGVGSGGDPDAELVRAPSEVAQLLITRLREGDPAALRELYQQEERRALALALRILGDAALAQDAVQEAFTQLWQRAEQISLDGGRIESLLMTIVRRRAVDLVRRRQTGARLLPDPELLLEIDERASAMLDRVEENLTTAGLRAALQAALAALPAEQREIVRQAYYGESTLREIAEREGLPLGTVKSRLRLAMTKLTETMRNQGRP